MNPLFLTSSAFVLFFAPLGPGRDPGTQRTIAYVQKLQTGNGSFLPKTPKKGEKLEPSLKSTSAAVRTLHYLGGTLANKARVRQVRRELP